MQYSLPSLYFQLKPGSHDAVVIYREHQDLKSYLCQRFIYLFYASATMTYFVPTGGDDKNMVKNTAHAQTQPPKEINAKSN